MSTITTDCDAPTISGDWKGRLRTLRCEHIDAGERIVFVCDDGSSIEMTLPIETSAQLKSALRYTDVGRGVDQIVTRTDRPSDRSNRGLSRSEPAPERDS